MTTEIVPKNEFERQLAKSVEKNLEIFRRDLCRIHAAAVERAPLPILCLDDRFGAGYQMALYDAADMLRKMGARK